MSDVGLNAARRIALDRLMTDEDSSNTKTKKHCIEMCTALREKERTLAEPCLRGSTDLQLPQVRVFTKSMIIQLLGEQFARQLPQAQKYWHIVVLCTLF